MANQVVLTFMDGAKVEVRGDDLSIDYEVTFINTETGELVYTSIVKAGHWTAANPKYYVRWRVVVKENGEPKLDHTLNLNDQNVLVIFDSKSMGDSIGWMPIVEAFRLKHNCRVTVATFHNDWFEEVYPEMKFITHGEATPDTAFHAIYRLGAYDRDYNKNRNLWRFVPLQQIASDMLGLPAEQIQPRIVRSKLPAEFNAPYVTISEFSTWYGKQWLRPGGWQELVDRIRAEGYDVVSTSKEPSTLKNITKLNNRPIYETIRTIQHSKAMVCVSCGPSVMAWALGVPTVIVSGNTMPRSEFDAAVRIYNDKVCYGCMNDPRFTLDRGNWKFCPTNRNFECSQTITVDMVWAAVEPILAGVKATRTGVAPAEFPSSVAPARILYLTPHCSTGGGPKYLERCVEEMKAAGHDICVVEYSNISSHYVIQKDRIKALVPFHTLNGNKTASLNKIFLDFKPDIVHLHEFPERFMDDESGDLLYSASRPYKIIETPHSQGMPARRWHPDGYVFVSDHHMKFVRDEKVPKTIAEYTLAKRPRPDRTMALKGLGLDPGKFHVLNVGLFCEWKNQGEIFDVARRLPDVQFHFIGNTADNFKAYWQPLLDHRPDNCTLYGERADVERFYGAMDLFFFASKSELNPIVLKEALSWSMPVVMRQLTNCPQYNREPLVRYYTDVDEAVGMIRGYSPSMRYSLEQAYSFREVV